VPYTMRDVDDGEGDNDNDQDQDGDGDQDADSPSNASGMRRGGGWDHVVGSCCEAFGTHTWVVNGERFKHGDDTMRDVDDGEGDNDNDQDQDGDGDQDADSPSNAPRESQ
jgi:hypothetical protein